MRPLWPDGVAGYDVRLVPVGDGVRLRVVECGPAAGEHVVVLPGWGASAWHVRKMLPALSAAGFRLHVIELPGHGGSDKPHVAEWYTLERLTGSVVAAMNSMGLERVRMVGQSMGGLTAMRIALDDALRVSRLALISAVGVVSPTVVTWLGSRLPLALTPLLPLLARRPLVALVLRSAQRGPERPTAEDVDASLAPSRDPAYARALFHLVRGVRWLAPEPAELRGLRVPLLVICGERDLMAPPRRARRVLRELPNARLEVIPRGGHVVNEGNPGMVNPLLEDFLSGP